MVSNQGDNFPATKIRLPFGTAQLCEKVQSLRIVADEDDLVAGFPPQAIKEPGTRSLSEEHQRNGRKMSPFQNQEFARERAVNRAPCTPISVELCGSTSSSSLVACTYEVVRKQVLASRNVVWQVEQFRVVTELLQYPDCLEGLRACASEELLDLWRDDEVTIQGKL